MQAERLEPLVESFNSQHKDVQVRLVRRVEGDAPRQLNLVTRDEHARFMASKASFKPLHEVMREAKVPFDAAKLAPELRDSLRTIGATLAQDAPAQQDTRAALKAMTDAARSLKALADNLERNPESLIRGKRNDR